MEKNIELVISQSIKENKWLDIVYKNTKGEQTYYWIAIKDIDLEKKILYVSMFNDNKSLSSIDGVILFNRIINAKILDFTHFDTPPKLIEKLEHNKDASWLKYETFNNNILKYYLECNRLDSDPYTKDVFMLEGIDKTTLLKEKEITLKAQQTKQILNYIKKYNKKSNSNISYLILSVLSIDEGGKRYVVLYYDITFNPSTKKLSINKIPKVNKSFLVEGRPHSITNYIEMDPSIFIENITKDINKYYKTYRELIRQNLKANEIINELPEFMIMARDITVNLKDTYDIIEKMIEEKILSYPLKAFFQNANRYGSKRKEPSIVIYDDKVNIDQMRVIYNTMKYPITYVIGPPGTGKTQTILNVVLSSFFNSMHILITSSNNKPVDNIIEKLVFNYKDIKIPFPYIRLGNRQEVLKAINKILDFYNMNTNISINEEVINKIKIKTNSSNKDLVNKLSQYEEKKDLKNRIESANSLIENITNTKNRLYKNTKKELRKLKSSYKEIPKITNDDVLSLVNSVDTDKYFKAYLYLESIKCIKKLKTSKYTPLINICSIKDEEERITEFNRWCNNDYNIKLLEEVFPVILTTNISASRLGTPYHKFDLVIMDEAGQCNTAVSLLPISRAKNLLLVGDTNQLKPVIILDDEVNNELKIKYKISDDYDYIKYSILDIMRMHDNISKEIMLTYHYRCGKKIINFSNKRFYKNKLNLSFIKESGKLKLIDVKNMNSKIRNENYEEAQAIVEYVKKNKLSDATIITPFNSQKNLINHLLEVNNINNIECTTVHQIQGAEKSTIIISSSVSPKTSRKTYDWIKNNAEITNVAVTRAKDKLIVVSDVEAINHLSDKSDDLYNLVNYVKANGKYDIEENKSYQIEIGKSNGSIREDELFTTLSQFCSVNNNFQVKRNVPVNILFYNDPTLSKSKQEFDIVIYKIDDTRLIPAIAIELNGGEHIGNTLREAEDKKKMDICKEKNITLIEIPNSYAKSYETIKELILNSCGEEKEQLELF